MKRTPGLKKLIAIAVVALLSTLLTPNVAEAANCTTTISDYTGDGTNGTSGVIYKVYTISQVGACTWEVPAGVTSADVLVVGGGGGGAGGHTGYTDGAGGGGGGGSFRADAYPLTPGASISVTVGTGGAGGTAKATSDTNQGSPGVTTIFDQISGGGGGGGGYAVGSTNNNGRAGTAGGGGGGSSNYWYAYDGGSGGTGSSVTVGAKTFTGVNGGTGGVYVSGQSATGDAGSGGGRSNATSSSAPAPGSGLSTYITGSNVQYGGGGKGKGASGWSTGAVQNGIGFGGNGGSDSTSGSAGASGVVIVRVAQAGAFFEASNYTAGSTSWPSSLTGGAAGTTSTGGMTTTTSPTGVYFAGKEVSNSDQLSGSIGSTSSLDTVTVEMWLKLTDNGSTQNSSGSMLFSWQNTASATNYNIYHYQSQIGFNTINSDLYGIDSSSLESGWHHYAFVMTDTGASNTQKIYVDGVLQSSTCRLSTCLAARTFNSSGNFLVMDNSYSTNTWNAKGTIGLVRIFREELSQAAVTSLYNATKNSGYLTAGLVTVNSFALQGSVTNAAYRTGINIIVNLSASAKVTFSANGKRIGNCVKVSTSGSSPNITATCYWKPSNRGRAVISAVATPSGGGSTVSAGPINVTVANRSGNR